MNILFAAFFGGWEVVLILAVVLVLFGAKKLPELAKGLGQGIKEFKKSSREIQEELNTAMDMDAPPPPPQRQIPPTPAKTEARVIETSSTATEPPAHPKA